MKESLRRYGSSRFWSPISSAYSASSRSSRTIDSSSSSVDRRQARRDTDLRGERAHLVAIAACGADGARGRAPRESSRPPAFGFPSASPPIQVPKRQRGRRVGQRAPVVGEQLLGRVDEALLEEPVAVADLVDDARPPRAHLVGLPVRGDLRGERRLDRRAPRRVRAADRRARASSAAMRRCEASTVRRVASVGCAVSTSWSETAPLELLRRRRPRAARRRRRATRPGRAARACTRGGGGRGGAARRRSRAGSTARTRAARSPAARAAAPRPLPGAPRAARPPREARASARTRSTSARSDSPSCSTSTRPEQVAEQADVAAQGCVRGFHGTSVGFSAAKPHNHLLPAMGRR